MLRSGMWSIAVLLTGFVVACGGAPASSVASDDGAAPAAVNGASEPARVSPTEPGGQFSFSGRMTDARQDHVAVLLDDGQVLVAGGRGAGGVADHGSPRLAEATTYDPSAGRWTDTGRMAKEREKATVHLLTDGRVFVIGGMNQSQDPVKTTEFYDPAAGAWTEGPRMKEKRIEHDSVLLPDGKVLVVGGLNVFFALVAEAEIFDPETGEWEPASGMEIGRARHTATLLNDGRVLVVGGGKGGEGVEGENFNSVELYDPATGSWSSAAATGVGHANHTATLLADGRVLITGGKGKVAETEIFDPSSGTWSQMEPMSVWRALHTASLLPDGRVIVAGGLTNRDSTEILDPETGVWSNGPPMTESRYVHTATVLDDGRVLLAGGQSKDKLSNTSEIYGP